MTCPYLCWMLMRRRQRLLKFAHYIRWREKQNEDFLVVEIGPEQKIQTIPKWRVTTSGQKMVSSSLSDCACAHGIPYCGAQSKFLPSGYLRQISKMKLKQTLWTATMGIQLCCRLLYFSSCFSSSVEFKWHQQKWKPFVNGHHVDCYGMREKPFWRNDYRFDWSERFQRRCMVIASFESNQFSRFSSRSPVQQHRQIVLSFIPFVKFQQTEPYIHC